MLFLIKEKKRQEIEGQLQFSFICLVLFLLFFIDEVFIYIFHNLMVSIHWQILSVKGLFVNSRRDTRIHLAVIEKGTNKSSCCFVKKLFFQKKIKEISK